MPSSVDLIPVPQVWRLVATFGLVRTVVIIAFGRRTQ